MTGAVTLCFKRNPSPVAGEGAFRQVISDAGRLPAGGYDFSSGKSSSKYSCAPRLPASRLCAAARFSSTRRILP